MKLIVVEPFGTGGITHYNYQLCTALSNQNIDITYLTSIEYELEDLPHNFKVEQLLQLWPKFEHPPESAKKKGYFTIFQNYARRFRRAFMLVREEIRLTNYLIVQRPDVVLFGTLFNFPFIFIFLRRLNRTGIRLIQICHESEVRKTGRDFLLQSVHLMNRQVYQLMDSIFVHAHSHRARFLSEFTEISADAVHVIPMGNESLFLSYEATDADVVRKKLGIIASETVILFFGRLSPEKGIDDLLESFSLLRKRSTTSLRLVIAGPPIMGIAAQLRLRIDELDLSNSVSLEASYIPSEDVKALMELADVAVYPYHNSSQSLALQVAYSCGVPVVVTNVGGLPEAVEDGCSGYIVPPNSPSELADAIEKIISDPKRSEEMGKYAYHLSQTKHSWAEVSKQILEIYKNSVTSP